MGREGFVGSCWGNRREREHWGDIGVDVLIILGWICGFEGSVYGHAGETGGKENTG